MIKTADATYDAINTGDGFKLYAIRTDADGNISGKLIEGFTFPTRDGAVTFLAEFLKNLEGGNQNA